MLLKEQKVAIVLRPLKLLSWGQKAPRRSLTQQLDAKFRCFFSTKKVHDLGIFSMKQQKKDPKSYEVLKLD